MGCTTHCNVDDAEEKHRSQAAQQPADEGNPSADLGSPAFSIPEPADTVPAT